MIDISVINGGAMAESGGPVAGFQQSAMNILHVMAAMAAKNRGFWALRHGPPSTIQINITEHV